MNRLSKSVIAAISLAAMTGSALAQDAEPAADPAADPAAEPAADPAAPAAEPMASGEVTVAPGKTIGVDGVFVLPLGDYADGASAAFGALGRFEFGINAALSVTARAGLIYNLAKEIGGVTPTILMIPVMGGVKYNIGTSGLFGHAEVGITHTRVSVDGFSDATTKLSFQGGAGYQMGKIQLRGGIYYIASDPALMGVMASAGFDFASL